MEEAKPGSLLKYKYLLVGILSFITLNLVALDVWLISSRGLVLEKGERREVEEKEVSSNVPSKQAQDMCPNTCLTHIYEATSSLQLVQRVSEPSETPSSQSSIVKEFFVPFGGGTNNTTDWSDVTGLTAYIDSTKYSKIKQIKLEASVLIPNGNQMVFVRLYNVTDKSSVWNSEITHEGGEPKFLVSNPISLENGNKLYQIQMKSQLGGPTTLHQSRLHIITE